VLPDRYALLGYPRDRAPSCDLAGEPFACVLYDPFEVSLVVREAVAEAMPEPATRLAARRVIVLEGQLGDDLSGFMAAVSTAIGARGVWMLALGAATRDHLLVADEQLDDALAALASLAGRDKPAP
jgi:hypothetical protein